MVGISMAEEETKTRRMEFELKAAQPPDPIYYRMETEADSTKLSLTEAPIVAVRRGRSAEQYMQ